MPECICSSLCVAKFCLMSPHANKPLEFNDDNWSWSVQILLLDLQDLGTFLQLSFCCVTLVTCGHVMHAIKATGFMEVCNTNAHIVLSISRRSKCERK